jgi:hypothetical protein
MPVLASNAPFTAAPAQNRRAVKLAPQSSAIAAFQWLERTSRRDRGAAV